MNESMDRTESFTDFLTDMSPNVNTTERIISGAAGGTRSHMASRTAELLARCFLWPAERCCIAQRPDTVTSMMPRVLVLFPMNHSGHKSRHTTVKLYLAAST